MLEGDIEELHHLDGEKVSQRRFFTPQKSTMVAVNLAYLVIP